MSHPFRKEHDAWIRKTERHLGTVNREHDVPYLAGSSESGGVTYIDRRVPHEIPLTHGRKIDPAVPLAIHEQDEHVGMKHEGMPYKPAHNRAERRELAWFLKRGYSRADFEKYDHEMKKLAARVTEKEAIKNPPKDLYLKPYTGREAHHIRQVAMRRGRK
jgi:hypothetical protein